MIEISGTVAPASTTIKMGPTSSLHGHAALHLETPNGRLMMHVIEMPTATGTQRYLEFNEGGQGSASLMRLTQQNCNDLLPDLVAFFNTGDLG